MPEQNRAMSIFSKTNSQTAASLMTLHMLEGGPYRVLRQIIAQIENKRAALKENEYLMAEAEVEIREITDKIANPTLYMKQEFGRLDIEGRVINYEPTESQIGFQIEKWTLERDKKASMIADAQTHIEEAYKEIGAYKDRYKEICKNNNIVEGEWDEQDFEESEIANHIKVMFRNGIRDRMQGPHNMGTQEYMESFGIEPVLAYQLIDIFILKLKEGMKEGKAPSIEMRYAFFDAMYERFKDEYKKAAKRIGLDSITNADFLMKENA